MATYMIQQGDTLYKIAQQYGVSVQDVINANPGVDPYNLHVGQIIRVPSPVNNGQQYVYQNQQIPQQQMPQQMPQQIPQQMPQQIPQQMPLQITGNAESNNGNIM